MKDTFPGLSLIRHRTVAVGLVFGRRGFLLDQADRWSSTHVVGDDLGAWMHAPG